VSARSDHHLLARILPWLGATVLLAAAVAGIGLFTGEATSQPSAVAAPSADDISFGPADAAVTVLEYSDFQCPFCAQYAEWLDVLHERYGDQVRFVYRFYPLAKHEYATISARAAYAAWKQGKFWEMHDLLFQNQDDWAEAEDPRPLFDAYAEELGLDLDRFHADADSQDALDFIEGQAAEGKAGGVKHTPWLVIDDDVVLPRSLEQFDALVREAL
jgi:protein-disulfide isomerase